MNIKLSNSQLIAFWDVPGIANDEVEYIKETIGAHRGIIDNTTFEGIFEEASENSEKFLVIVRDRELEDDLKILINEWLFENDNFWKFAWDRFKEDVGEALAEKSSSGCWLIDETDYISITDSYDTDEFLKSVYPDYRDKDTALYIFEHGEGLILEIWDTEDGKMVYDITAMPSVMVEDMEAGYMEGIAL